MRKKARHLKKPKFPDHQNLAKGGVVRQNFDTGGVTLGGPTTSGTIGNAVNPQNQGFTGSIGGTLGLNNTFQAAGAPIQQGTNADQLNAAYSGTQGALGAQTGVANALVPGATLGAGEQAGLASQYENMIAGKGPNPAQAQLNQATGQNVANTTAEMAGQRGASSNVGLIARQAAQQGAATQQQAAGQAATLEAQQQVAAQNNLATLASNQVNQAGQAVTNATNANVAEQGVLQNANTSANNANVSQQGNVNNVNSQVAQSNADSNSNVLSGITNAVSGVAGAIGSIFAKGGEVHRLADGGPVNLGSINSVSTSASAPSSPSSAALPTQSTPAWAQKQSSGGGGSPTGDAEDTDELEDVAEAEAHGGRIGIPHDSHFHAYFGGGKTMNSGGTVKAVVSPKEVYLSPDKVERVMREDADPMKIGHHFPGRDKVRGRDSLKNDVIPTTLQDGGVVIPVHITEHKDASQRSRKFVRNAIAKHMKKPERRA